MLIKIKYVSKYPLISLENTITISHIDLTIPVQYNASNVRQWRQYIMIACSSKKMSVSVNPQEKSKEDEEERIST